MTRLTKKLHLVTRPYVDYGWMSSALCHACI